MADADVKDARVRRTQRRLRDAIISLIHEKSYPAIVVNEILERADVGRSAFYAHFSNKDALLRSLRVRLQLEDRGALVMVNDPVESLSGGADAQRIRVVPSPFAQHRTHLFGAGRIHDLRERPGRALRQRPTTDGRSRVR